MPRKHRSMPRKKKKPDAATAALNLITEAGVLKSVRRSGWWMIGMTQAESVAEHSFRTGFIGYLLAKMEKVSPYAVVMMSLLNDLHETRINDLHKVGHRYIDFREAEQQVSEEQLQDLPKSMQDDLRGWSKELAAQKTKASLIARDADLLECMIQGKEYAEQGHPMAIEWMTRPAHLLRTSSGKKLYRKMKQKSWKTTDWWQGLLKLDR